MYVFERMAKEFTRPEETKALAYHFYLKKYEGKSTTFKRAVKFKVEDVYPEYNPFNTVNS